MGARLDKGYKTGDREISEEAVKKSRPELTAEPRDGEEV